MSLILTGIVVVFNIGLMLYLFVWNRRLTYLRTTNLWGNIKKIKYVVLVNIIFLGILSILILLRPNLGIEQSMENIMNSDISYIFIIDTSSSMKAKDINGQTRMQFVKDFVRKVLDNYPGYSSLILFTEIPTLTLPFTFDTHTVLTFVDALVPEFPIYARGTDVAAALKLAKKYMNVASKKLGKKIKPIIFLLTDGECVNASCNVFDFGNTDYEKFLVIGVGTEKGEQIEYKLSSSSGDKIFILRDPKKLKPVITKLNEAFLRRLAQKNKNAKYFSWIESSKAIKEVEAVYKTKNKKSTKNKLIVKKELYPFLVVLFVVIFIIFIFDVVIYEFYYKIKI